MDESGIPLSVVTPMKDKTAKGMVVNMEVDGNLLGKEAMANALAETDKTMLDMTTDENPMGEEAKVTEEAKKAAETNPQDNPTYEKAKAAGAARKMAQRVADMRYRGGARASTGDTAEDQMYNDDGKNNDDLEKSTLAQRLIQAPTRQRQKK